ncbi:GNAT family N-acetyltransferase [Haloechinothrix sp. LS1_15]|uniref:GNAT family N-acetyltransferase n=1 Tax=Haloechinothrix sp. LS1_15 TaxID=2652248 RepID=UPI00294709BD|nr:GNAT family N-acetyltransferase [Haloechinothrix sp. LS1_15]MDV6014325.1 GNAT family N-acetyltransferase [Haloechinothrix sp. LS1_15]
MPVRDARASDVEEICTMIEEHAAYEGNGDLRLDRQAMAHHLFGEHPKAWVVLAHPEGEPDEVAGFVFCCWNFSTWEGKPGIWMDDLFIRPDYRRLGLGRELLDELRARTGGRVEWEMQEGNDKAARFYASLGAYPVTGWVRYRWKA